MASRLPGTRSGARVQEHLPLHAAHEPVVLLDAAGRPRGTEPKATVHHAATPFHLAFSCHVVDARGRVLITRRSAAKATWPGTWTNACCGHPLPGETLRAAVTRRLRDELGVVPRRMAVALPDFAYRAVMGDGVVEHELCPVVVAEVDGDPDPDPAEVGDVAWLPWEELVERARRSPETLSPWSVEQIDHLAARVRSPHAWLVDRLGPGPTAGAEGSGSDIDGTGTGDGGVADPALDRPPGVTGITGGTAAASRPGPAAPTPVDPLAVVRGPVDAVLAAFLAERQHELVELDPAVAELGAEVRRLVAAGGKRLRPAFVYWGHRAAGEPHDDAVLTAAAAVELLHTFALVHDDVMDRSDRRRGQPTAHRSLADRHAGAGLVGDAGWYGVSGALLAGDLAFVWADQLLEATGRPPAPLAAARRVFTRLRTEVVGGQLLDLRLAHRPLAEVASPAGAAALEREVLRVALLKSARYTVTRPLELGLALAGAVVDDPADVPVTHLDPHHDRLRAALRVYGDAVGVAFQMRDDVLGLFGDHEATGKSCLDDLREGKRTLLVLRALRLADDAGRRLLVGALGDPDLDEATAHRCRQVVAASGALASVEALIEAEHDRALRALRSIGPPPARAADPAVPPVPAGPAEAQDALATLAALATRRDR
ncbi:MAG TPA: isopentenyl-diphosphate Delta-isomerase [Acidimicrobiales bacterium]